MAGSICKKVLQNGQLFQQSIRCFAVNTEHNKKITLLRQQKRNSSTSLDLSGIYPPIATPFKDDEEINWDALNSNLKKWEELPFRGLL